MEPQLTVITERIDDIVLLLHVMMQTTDEGTSRSRVRGNAPSTTDEVESRSREQK